MKTNVKKRRHRVPDAVIAARKAQREIERETLGDGFHARTRPVRNRKRYTRKAKHKGAEQE